MSAGTIAALIAAGALVVLVLVLTIPLLKLGRTLDEATLAIRKTHESAIPLIGQAQDTIRGVNAQLDQVDGITRGVNSMTTNVAAVTSIASSAVASPLIKVAAFSYGVRKTVARRREAEAERTAKQRHRAARQRTRAARRKRS